MGAQPTALARPGRPDPAWAPLPARLGRPGSTWLARFGFDGRPGRPRDTIFEDPGSAFGSIFVVFRGGLARATRLAGRRAEPLFLLAGAVLWRVRRRGDNAENRLSSSKNRPDDGSRTSSAYDLWRLSLLGATWCRIWSPRRDSGRSWPLPAHKLDRSWPPGPTPIDRLRSTWVPRPTPKHPL